MYYIIIHFKHFYETYSKLAIVDTWFILFC